MATVGGNLLQRTRCRTSTTSRRRATSENPGSGCRRSRASTAPTRSSATRPCVATHPSDMCVALVALDAVVHTWGRTASARSRSTSCTRCPATRRSATPCSNAGELITAVDLPARRRQPPLPQGPRPRLLRVRPRSRSPPSYVDGGSSETPARPRRVAHKPWREASRAGAARAPGQPGGFLAAADAELPPPSRADNAFKVELAPRTLMPPPSSAPQGRVTRPHLPRLVGNPVDRIEGPPRSPAGRYAVEYLMRQRPQPTRGTCAADRPTGARRRAGPGDD